MKTSSLFLLFFFFIYSIATAQNPIVKYYDKNWLATTGDKAVFYAHFIKSDSLYTCHTYWSGSNKLRGKSTFSDTVLINPVGQQVLFHENGNTADSNFFDQNGKMIYSYHYYDNKGIAATFIAKEGKKPVVEGFDETGKKIENYIFFEEAEFKGGDKAWQSYLAQNLNGFLARGDAEQTVQVIISFIVDENGNVTIPKVLQSSGYKNVDADALKVIRSSPPWRRAVIYNQPIKAYRNQPVTYILSPKKAIDNQNQ